jgi:hypothetical protein
VFKVKSRNSVGLSPFSPEVAVLAAQIPDQPVAPATADSVDGMSVLVSWALPYNGGSAVTGFKIQFRHSDGVTFSSYDTTCNGNDQAIKDALSCEVDVTVFRATPYQLPWGSEVYARVAAINIKGQSLYSQEANGAVILTNPDAPLNLADNPVVTSGSTIGLVWNEGAEYGGTPVIDYQLSYDEGAGTEVYVIIESNIADKFYAVTTGLTSGVSYKFKV